MHCEQHEFEFLRFSSTGYKESHSSSLDGNGILEWLGVNHAGIREVVTINNEGSENRA
jgi:hypothetical protein